MCDIQRIGAQRSMGLDFASRSYSAYFVLENNLGIRHLSSLRLNLVVVVV